MSSSLIIRAFLFVLLSAAINFACANEFDNTTINKLEQHAGFALAFQLGGAFALVTWAVIRSLHTKQKIYIFFIATLTLAILRLILNQSALLSINTNLTEEQIQILNPFLNLGTMINGLYTIHLATMSPDMQAKRKFIYYLIYALTIAIACTSLFISRPLFMAIALAVVVFTVAVIIYDLVHSIKNNQEGPRILTLKVLILGTLLTAMSINIISFIHASVNDLEGMNPANRGIFAFILCGILFVYLVTVMDQRTSDKNTRDASDALKVAADESALRQNQQRFLSMLMHEIRTPLSVIKIGADAITKPMHPSDPPSIWTQRIDTAIDNIAQVIDNCVQAEKQESGLIQPTIQKHQLKKELESLHKEYLSANAELESRIKFDIDIQEDAYVVTDINYVRSILLNLIGNAYKYSAPFSTIDVRVLYDKKYSPNSILFQVENSLGKVEAPDPDQLFQRYYRSESAKKFAGTGLGLWLSQTLAHQIGSHIKMKTTDQQSIIFFFRLQATH